ncbi:hypothetical protein [Arthrobacter sp. 35W]|uniref:hypothetical protein n=1 Tax=Arthrobacter sp. 35W TaxID=1132441 RepID=UPI0004270402|nr:hypothetical protein [Arthrobacter sp. 35W]
MNAGPSRQSVARSAKVAAGTVVAAATLAAVTAFSGPGAAPVQLGTGRSTTSAVASSTVRAPSASGTAVAPAGASTATLAGGPAVSTAYAPSIAERIAGVQEDLARAVSLRQVTAEQAALFEAQLVRRITSEA